MHISPYKAYDLHELMIQPAQAHMRDLLLSNGYPEALEAHDSYTGRIDGRVVACAGMIPLWEGVVRAWAVIGADIGPGGMTSLHRAARRAIAACPARRIEIEVVTSFKEAHRWVRMLGGFEREGTMRKYTPDGQDCDKYARVK